MSAWAWLSAFYVGFVVGWFVCAMFASGADETRAPR